MASNALPDPLDDLFTLAEDMADGCHNHQAAIGLKQNTETDVRTDLANAVTAQEQYQAALSAKTDLSTAVTVADSNGKAFISAASSVLAQILGGTWSQAWVATGFPDLSTGVPSTQSKRQALLLSLQNYFTANPAYEINTPSLSSPPRRPACCSRRFPMPAWPPPRATPPPAIKKPCATTPRKISATA